MSPNKINFKKAGPINKCNEEVQMYWIQHQSVSGTKCYLYKVIQMEIDLENLDPPC